MAKSEFEPTDGSVILGVAFLEIKEYKLQQSLHLTSKSSIGGRVKYIVKK